MREDMGEALEWWLRGQGKFIGAKITTSESLADDGLRGDNNFKLKEWVVDGIQEPSEKDIDNIITAYREVVNNKKLEEALLRGSVISRFKSLGFTDDEIREFLVKP